MLPVDIRIAVCQHVVQQQLHALRRREVFLPVVMDDRAQRAVDVVVAHALVIQQPRDALAHASLGADVFVVARLAARPADELAALLGKAHLLLQDRRRVSVIAVQLGVVELEGVHAPLAHARAVAPVDVLILIHAIDILFRVHGQRAVFQSFFNLLRVPLVAVLKKIDALARVHGVRFALFCALCGVWLCGRQITLAHALRALRRRRRLCGHGVLLPNGWRGCRFGVLLLHRLLRCRCGLFRRHRFHRRRGRFRRRRGALGLDLCASSLNALYAAAQQAERAADEEVVQDLRRVKLAVILSGTLPVVDRLQGRLHKVLDDLLAALRQERQGEPSRRVPVHLGNRSVDCLVEETAAECFLERRCDVADLLCRDAHRAARRAVQQRPVLCVQLFRRAHAGLVRRLRRLLRVSAEYAQEHRAERAAAAERRVGDHLRACHADVIDVLADRREPFVRFLHVVGCGLA